MTFVCLVYPVHRMMDVAFGHVGSHPGSGFSDTSIGLPTVGPQLRQDCGEESRNVRFEVGLLASVSGESSSYGRGKVDMRRADVLLAAAGCVRPWAPLLKNLQGRYALQ